MNLQFTKLLLRHCLLAATLLLFASATSYAQKPTDPEAWVITAKAKYYEGRVYLRWEPKNFATLTAALNSTFRIKRWTSKENGNELPPAHAQTTVQEWTVRIGSQQTLQGIGADATEIARMALYEPLQFQVTGLDDDPVKKAYKESTIPEERLEYIQLAANQAFEYAEAIGLGYIDHNVIPNHEYNYVISIDGTPLNRMTYGKVTITTEDVAETAITDLTTEGGDLSVLLKWTKPEKGSYSAYNIYRTIALANNFEKINQVPYIYAESERENFIQFQDKLPNNTTEYQYYVVGIDDFGMESLPSPTKRGKGKPKPIDVSPFITQAIETREGKFEIKWNFPTGLNYAISSFEIRSATERDGNYVLIQTVDFISRSYIDMFPKPTNYYVVVAKDKNGYDIISTPKLAQLKDEIPPVQVTQVEGVVSEDGSAFMKWKANTELDLLGYQVLVSNRKDEGYVVVTESWLTSNEFYYYFNVATLSEEVWVQIGAIDYHHNRSVLSVPYRLRLPDLIAPTAPVLKKVEPVTKGILITWNKSQSKDVQKHKVQRRMIHEEDAEWETLKEFPTIVNFEADTVYIDTISECRVEYDYRVTAEDEVPWEAHSSVGRAAYAGLRCNYPVMNAHAFYSPVRIKPSKSTIIKTTKGLIIIVCDFPCAAQVFEFKIYRRFKRAGLNKPWSPFILIKSVSPEDARNKSYFPVTDKNGKIFMVGSPQPYGISGSGGAGEGGNTTYAPPSTVSKKKLRASICNYTIEDDDFNTLLNMDPDDEVEYSIQAEYTDGTISEMSAVLKP